MDFLEVAHSTSALGLPLNGEADLKRPVQMLVGLVELLQSAVV
jgi:hypothetical protein